MAIASWVVAVAAGVVVAVVGWCSCHCWCCYRHCCCCCCCHPKHSSDMVGVEGSRRLKMQQGRITVRCEILKSVWET